ncbi:nicotinamide riboside transporter PnuC [soil metagenome]
MSILEGIAVALGLANIVLLVRRSVWNYPFGIAMVSLYALIFFEARLYSDVLLQGFFLILNLYGWWHWHGTGQGQEVPVRWLSRPGRVVAVSMAIAASAGWGSMMARYTDAAAPHWDATVAMLSVLSQFLLAKRFIENWIGWVVVDVLAVGLYWSRGLHLTAGLYGVFLILSIVGLRQWTRARRA